MIVDSIVQAAEHCHSDVHALIDAAHLPYLKWPPTDLSQLDCLYRTLDRWFRSADPAWETYWRLGTALAFCLWLPLPEEATDKLSANLNEVGFSQEEINDVMCLLRENVDRRRLEGIEIIRTRLRRATVPMSHSAPRVFISYCHTDMSKVQKIEEDLGVTGIELVRDKRELGYTEDIDSYMKKIRATDYALILVHELHV